MINIVVFIGPSGAGKTTLQRLINLNPIVTWTSRTPRAGEVDGMHYHFESKRKMLQMINEGLFLEHTQYNGNLYGTSLESIEKLIHEGKIGTIVLDENGARAIKKTFPKNVLMIGVFAPFEECCIRLSLRDDDSSKERLANYQKELIAMQSISDIMINNSETQWTGIRDLLFIILNGLNPK